MAALTEEAPSRIDAIARWRSALVGIIGMALGVAGVVIVSVFAPPEARGEALTAISGIVTGVVSVIVIRHAGQDRDKAAP